MSPRANKKLRTSSQLLNQRLSGVLLHPTSLPGGHGCGDLGDGARRFVRFLEKGKQGIWQVLPTGPTTKQEWHSPYSSFSAFAGNPLLISLEDLASEGLLSKQEVRAAERGVPGNLSRVDFEATSRLKYPLLFKAASAFQGARAELALKKFLSEHSWAKGFSEFAALRFHFGVERQKWPEHLRFAPSAMSKGRRDAAIAVLGSLKSEIRNQLVLQYFFFSQWAKLRAYALERGVHLLGDLPIYVSSDSADVWAHPEFFEVDRTTGAATMISGVPPDVFNSNGQLWGHPLYKWSAIQRSEFSWWKARFRTQAAMFDVVRVDHFRGFESFWAVPAGAKNAKGGSWKLCPGHALFKAVKEDLGELPIFVEDLGIITPPVHALREAFGFMGTRVLQFSFSGDVSGSTKSRHHPVNIPHNSVVYTGTHDNAPTAQWFKELPGKNREKVLGVLNDCAPSEVPSEFIRLGMASAARFCIFTAQDLIGGGRATRMNLPGTTSKSNWSWRLSEIPTECAEQLARLSEVFERNTL